MDGEGFLHRWSRLKSGASAEARLPADGAEEHGKLSGHESARVQKQNESRSATGAGTSSAISSVPKSPTLDDAMRLTPESDYSAFVARGVDKAVRRMALKKLFADPHFNQLDGLDIYMDDYNRAAPLPATMLAALRQAQGFLQEQVASDENGSDGSGNADEQGGSIRAAADDDGDQPESESGRNES